MGARYTVNTPEKEEEVFIIGFSPPPPSPSLRSFSFSAAECNQIPLDTGTNSLSVSREEAEEENVYHRHPLTKEAFRSAMLLPITEKKKKTKILLPFPGSRKHNLRGSCFRKSPSHARLSRSHLV